jgi:tight adherence protein B
MDLILFLGIFIVVLVLAQALFMFVRSRFNPEVVRLKREISTLSAGRNGASGVDIVKKRILSQIPWLNKILVNLQAPTISRLERLHQQADARQPLGFFILLSVATAAVGAYLTFVMSRSVLAALVAAGLAALLPWVYLSFRKNKRLRAFERQLPDALDMIARALKAGHALTGGFQMVAMEFADPARTEFRKTLDEINFGQSYEDALRNMSKRFDCPDLKFFVLSVIIQRQSGGNMAEILEKIGSLIRERFKLFGKVKALTGEARISAVVLTILPFAIAAAIYFLNRNYMEVLFTEPAGQIMVGAAAVMMVLGIFVMRRMITIEV